MSTQNLVHFTSFSRPDYPGTTSAFMKLPDCSEHTKGRLLSRWQETSFSIIDSKRLDSLLLSQSHSNQNSSAVRYRSIKVSESCFSCSERSLCIRSCSSIYLTSQSSSSWHVWSIWDFIQASQSSSCCSRARMSSVSIPSFSRHCSSSNVIAGPSSSYCYAIPSSVSSLSLLEARNVNFQSCLTTSQTLRNKPCSSKVRVGPLLPFVLI